MSFGTGLRNGLAIGLRTIATLSGKIATSIPVVGNFLATQSLVILTTENGEQLLVEPVI
jgi:hypothetical protein